MILTQPSMRRLSLVSQTKLTAALPIFFNNLPQ